MSPERQRVVIAQVCGWTKFEPDTIQYLAQGPDGKWGLIPNYLRDLNAMHEAEKLLTGKQFSRYAVWLARVIAGTQNAPRASGTRVFCGQRFLLSATAAQRAEAFLRTLSLWEEDETPQARHA